MENYEFSTTENIDTLSSELNGVDQLTSTPNSGDAVLSEMHMGEMVSSQLNEKDQIDSELDQPTVHKYTGGETDNIIVNVDNDARVITATLKPIKFKTAADFPVVGSDRLLYIDATENSLYSWDSDIGEYRKLVADTGDIEIDLDDYFTKTESDARYGASIDLSLDSSTYVITAQLKDANGNNVGVAKTIDLPLESVVVNGEYDSATKEVVLTLDSGSSIRFSVADLVSGLQSEITATNKLASDLVDDANSINKFVTQGDKDKLAGIEEGANKTVVDSEFSGTSTNPLQNKLITEKFRDVVWKNIDQSINSVKTFEKQPMIADSVGDEYSSGRYIISAQKIREILRENYQEKLVEGNNITIDGNIISANLEGSTPIVTLPSPVVIYDLPAGVYQLPAGCDLYINSSYVETNTKVTYDNKSVALMVVNIMKTTSGTDDRLFYLFAEQDGVGTDTVGNSGSFIVGKAKEGTGSYHVAGTDIKYVTQETDGYINGNKSFVNPVKYYNQYESLATSLNDRTLVDAQWVKKVLEEQESGITEEQIDNKLTDYLPLSAGSGKTLTGPLFTNSNIEMINSRNIYGKTLQGEVIQVIGTSADNNVYINRTNSGNTCLGGASVLPKSDNTANLGTADRHWNNIYGTTIYQNGKQVANKEDIPDTNSLKTIIGANAPTASTVGATGQFYHATNEDSDYICVGTFSDGTYNWKLVGGALYLPTSGGTVTGNLTVNQTLTVGNANIAYNSTDKCLKFTFN